MIITCESLLILFILGDIWIIEFININNINRDLTLLTMIWMTRFAPKSMNLMDFLVKITKIGEI